MFAQWASRCLPGLSILALFALLLLTSTDVLPGSWKGPPKGKGPTTNDPTTLSLAQTIFIVYTILVHLNTLLFTGRLSWALSHAFRQTSKVLKRRSDQSPSTTPEPGSPLTDDSLATALDMKRVQTWATELPEEITHAIILPNYNEDIGTLRDTLNVLASHPRARTQYEV